MYIVGPCRERFHVKTSTGFGKLKWFCHDFELQTVFNIMKKVSVYIDCIKSTIDYSIGGNAKENFELIDNAMPNDIWFHIDGLPSEHVIASIPENLDIDRKKRLKIAKQGALLCKQHSKYASQKNVSIVYTEIQNVTKTEVLGQVNVNLSKVIVI